MRQIPLTLSSAFFAFLLPALPSLAETCPALPPVSNMKLTFEDEFNKPSLDATKWTDVAQGGAQAINNEQQAYVPGNVQMVPGVGARLQVKKEPFLTQPYTSSEIITQGHFAQAYGYFEMKVRFPDGNGLWPAFWLLPSDGSWPPEVGVAEYVYAPWGKHTDANSGYISHGFFWPVGATKWRPSDASAHSSNTEVYLTDNYKNPAADPHVFGDWGTAFHTYGVAWYPGMMAFYVDGTPNLCWIESAETKGSVPAKPMFIVANLAVGAPGGWAGTVDSTTQFPANMDIAYVRAYQFAKSPAPAPDPVTFTNVAVSSATAHPGDTVTISTDLVIGGELLSRPAQSNLTIFNYDATQRVTTIDFPSPTSFAPNMTYHLRTQYTVADSQAPGIYTMYPCVFWKGGPQAGTCLASNHAPSITVVEAGH
jgi:beta-glucanase (GH16 family)